VNLEAAEFTTFGYDQRVVAFNGRPIIKVDPSRMYTAIKTLTLENGEGGGWMPADDAKKINFIAVARYAPIGVNKVDRPKIFEPEENQTHDGWKLTYRRYHDLWVMENKRKMIAVSISDSSSELPTINSVTFNSATVQISPEGTATVPFTMDPAAETFSDPSAYVEFEVEEDGLSVTPNREFNALDITYGGTKTEGTVGVVAVTTKSAANPDETVGSFAIEFVQ
jgi:hypothetical protein